MSVLCAILMTCRAEGQEGSEEVAPGLFLQRSIPPVHAFIQQGHASPQDFRIFLGHAGWGPGQLAGEVGMHTWIPAATRSAEALSQAGPEEIPAGGRTDCSSPAGGLAEYVLGRGARAGEAGAGRRRTQGLAGESGDARQAQCLWWDVLCSR